MKKFFTSKELIFIVIGILFIIGAIYYGTPKQEEQITQIANPASVFCVEKGGKLIMRSNEEGEYGVCIFDNGENEKKECEEWAMFRGDCPIGGIVNSEKQNCPSFINCMPGPDINETCKMPSGCEGYTEIVY